MNRCQIMLPNRMQCPNPVWATENGVDYCRLHFSYMLAQKPLTEDLVNPRTVQEENAPDLAMMLKHKEDAKKLAESKTQEEKEKGNK